MKGLSLICVALLAVACSKSNSKRTFPQQVEKRFTPLKTDLGSDEILTMVKLKTPALFATATVDKGEIKIDEKQLEALKKEQLDFLAEVKKISDKIEVLYRYQYTMNGFTLKTPKSLEKKIKALNKVALTQKTTEIAPPSQKLSHAEIRKRLDKSLKGFGNTSVEFINAHMVQTKYGHTGKGLSVGILDTGIDFTHSMFAGPGTVRAFQSVEPTKAAPVDLYPNKKVLGGIDLVGDNYFPRSLLAAKKLPKPDKNPIDIQGHGSHVAGTVAGIGDGIDSYSGVAPEADLHAIKVFGGSSTGDFVVIAGFEYAADPNNDNNPSDALDVLNLSLGGAYGIPGNLYDSAIKNLTRVGISVVASAGNSGDVSYITGAPATSTDALSVGASIDNMDHNWKFDALSLESSQLDKPIITGYGTASFTISLADVDRLSGALVYAGLAAEDFDADLKAKLAGKIALIDRGAVSFGDKVQRALDAKAIAVIIANNQPEGVMQMGGVAEPKLSIPAVMIPKAQRDVIKKILDAGGEVIADLKTSAREEKPELIDTLTGFSSRGPRSLDSAIKPEIVGPGQQIVSADAGTGNKMVKLNGTSMSGPHLAGVMTLMKQAYPELSVIERKAIVIGSAKPISDTKGNLYPVSRQGAGRVQTLKAVEAKLFAMPATMSLGEVNVKKAIVMRKEVTLYNKSSQVIELQSKIIKQNKLEIKMPESVSIPANSEKKIKIEITIKGDKLKQVDELDAIISFENETKKLVIPMLAVAKRLSAIEVDELKVLASEGASEGAAVDLKLKNKSPHDGVALIFNKLIKDERRTPNQDLTNLRNNFCDLQSAGYRIIEENGKKMLEVGVKTYGPQEVWSGCSVSVLIDSDGDKEPNQQIIGTVNSNIPGLIDVAPSLQRGAFQSFLIDYQLAKTIREKTRAARRAGEDGLKLNITPAIQATNEFEKYDHSTISILRAELDKLNKSPDGSLSFKVSVDSRDSEVNESDDFAGDKNSWTKLNPFVSEGAFVGMPAKVEVNGNAHKSIELTKGLGEEDLLLYYPYNMTTRSILVDDKAQEVKAPTYAY